MVVVRRALWCAAATALGATLAFGACGGDESSSPPVTTPPGTGGQTASGGGGAGATGGGGASTGGAGGAGCTGDGCFCSECTGGGDGGCGQTAEGLTCGFACCNADGDHQACIMDDTGTKQCIDVPVACDGDETCSCMEAQEGITYCYWVETP